MRLLALKYNYASRGRQALTSDMKILTIVVMALLLQACSSMLVGGSASGGKELGSDSRSTAQMNTDDRLTGTIRSRLAQDTEISRYNVSVSTYNAVVTLSGTVGSFAVRDRAVRIARDTDGVQSIRNQVSVNTQQ